MYKSNLNYRFYRDLIYSLVFCNSFLSGSSEAITKTSGTRLLKKHYTGLNALFIYIFEIILYLNHMNVKQSKFEYT